MITNEIIEEKVNFLFNCIDKNNNCDLNEINNVVDDIKKIFEIENFYVILFEKYAIKNKNKNLFSIIIEILINKLILNEEISENDVKFKNILIIFPFLLENLIITKQNVEIIFKNLSTLYFNNNILNSKILLKYLLLLEAIFKKPEKKIKIKQPKNFFYFFDESFFELELNENSIQIPEKGIVISIYLKLINEEETKEESNKIKKIISFTNENNEKFNFILNKNELELFDNKLNKIFESKKNSIKIEFNKIFLFNLFINKKQIKLFINNEQEFIFENKIGNNINNIKFFINCNGICSCILILNCKKIYANFQKINNFLSKEFEIGINKKNYITKFTQNIITLDDFYGIYLPFSYENQINNLDYEIEIEELLNKNKSIFLNGNFCGIHNYICNIKNITNLGGIYNLLPIIEMIMINIDKLNDNLLEILKTFLKIIENIFINDKKNNDYEKKKFIEILSIFLENFPKELFNLDIINILIKIADLINSDEIKKIFYDNLLLNEKLYFQFNKESQNKLIQHLIKIVNEFSIEKIINIISIEKLCLLIKYYDEQKDKKYCCDYHYKSFINNNDNIDYNEFIMNPSIPEISENLSELIINLLLKIEIDKSNLPFILFKLLLLDVSPCVMKFIIKIFLNLCKSKDFLVRLNTKNFFAKKNYDFFINVTKNVLNRCLFDVLVDYIELLTFILKNDNKEISENIQNIINENIIHDFDFSNDKKCIYTNEYINNNIERIYKFLMILFLGKFNEELIITEKDNINNELLIDGLIKIMKLLNNNNKKLLSIFLKDLNQLFLTNCKNCFICYKNNNLIEFILENFINVYLITIDEFDKIFLDCCNQIFFNLFKNSISFLLNNEKQIEDSPINILNKLLIFCKKKETEENKEKLNDFINLIFIQYFYFLKSKIKNFEISINNNILINLITFFSICIDRTFFYSWKDFENFDNFNYEIIKNEVNNIIDYDNLKNIYDCIKNIFNLNNIYKKSEINLKEDYNNNLFEKNEKIIKNFIFNKKFRSENLNNLLLLNYVYDENKNMKLNKGILLFIIFSYEKSKDEKTKIEWLNELNYFTLFYIISSCNLFKEDSKNYFDIIQNDSFDIIYFCLKFLNKQFLMNENEIKSNIKLSLKEIFSLLIMINDQINEKNIQKNKGFLSIFGNKEKIQFFFELSVYKLFNNYTKINYSLKDFKDDNFDNIPEFYLYDPQNLININLFNNQELIKRIYYIFNLQKIKNYFINRLNKKDNNNNKINFILNNDNEDETHINYIKNLIFNYYQEIYKYSNSTFLIIKERRNFYKRIKKKLFLWKGMWSNDEDLYNNKYKYKVINHYTKILSRPLLMPILDINYYEPKFSGFNVNNLFIEKNDCHLVNLDIDEIFNKKNNNNLNNIEIEDTKKNTYFYDILNNNKYEGNFINVYLKFSENVDLLNEENYFIQFFNSIRELNEPESYLRKFENVYKCCFVKTEHHVKGLFFINKNCISFKVFINKNELPDDNYDEEHKNCYGSVFNDSHKDKDILNFNIPFNKIKIIFKRRYFQMNNSFEIFTKNLKSYYFKFKNFKERENCLKDIRKHIKSLKNKTILKKIILDQIKTEENIGVIAIRNKGGLSKKKKLSNLIKKWQNGFISNFEFLMWINLYSNRSYSDIFQYPIFPWIFETYNSEKLNLNTDFRDLSLPMGMLECNNKSIERKEYYIEHYESMIEEENKKENEDEENLINNRKPFIYGTIFSNATYVSHFLSRIFPYSNMSIEMQGNHFDVVDRLFLSVEKCFEMASTQKSDVRELIPEFYILPEMFENLNKINMGKLENDEYVNNVDIPKWAEKDNYKFVYLKKKYLESEEISLLLNKWIDLIFGFKTRGKEAIIAKNLFFPEAYEIDIEKLTKEEKEINLKYFEFGVMPKQISCIEFPSKKILIKNIFDKDCNKIICSSLFKVNVNDTLLNNFFIIREKQRIIIIYQNQDVNIFKINIENIEKKNENIKERNMSLDLTAKNIELNNIENNINSKQNENQIQTGILENLHGLSNKIKKITNTISTKSENKINPISAEKSNTNFLFSTKYNFFEQCKYYNNLKEHKHPPILLLQSITEQNIITLCQGGFYNSKLVFTNINYTNYNLKIKDKVNNLNGYYTFRVSNEPYIITSLCLKEDKEEYLDNEVNIFCGNSNGAVFLIEIINLPFKPKFNVLKKIINNSININSIFYSKNLYVLGTSSLDGFINLYTIPSFKFFRSIKIDNELFTCDEIFLITSPLPSVIILNYKNHDKEILSYNINGKFLNKVKEERGILSPKIGCDSYFNEYLVYLIEDEEKKIIIRDLPYLNIKTEILIKFNDAEIIQIDKYNKYIYIGNKQGNEWIYLK